jgi:hypothetical protein
MSRLSEFFSSLEPVNSESITNTLNDLFSKFEIPVEVDGVIVDFEGHIFIDLKDHHSNVMRVIFTVDEDGIYAIVDTDEENLITFDLEPMRPTLRKGDSGTFVDLTDGSWITKSLLKSIVSAGDLYSKPTESLALRGGKPTRIPLVAEKKRHRLSQRQKEALAKSLIKRKNINLSNKLNLDIQEN